MPTGYNPNPNPQRRPNWLLPVVAGLGLIGIAAWLVLRPGPTVMVKAPPVVVRTNLVFATGHWYELPKANLFTGWMVEFHPSGIMSTRVAVSNGLLNGVSEGYYTNGQVQIREYYKDSVADGRRQKWYENGQQKSEALIVAGKLEGNYRSWHENGQLAEQFEMKQGNPEGEAWAYYVSGFAKAKTSVRAGEVLTQTSWADGEYRPTPAAVPQPLRP